MGLTLNLADHSVTGVCMENLISLWCARGLTYEQGQVLLGASYSVQRLDYLFAKCLDKDKDAFETVRCRIMMTLDVWEEIPAWDEVWRLKRAFDKLEADLHPTIKLYTIIICEILPDMVAKRHKLKEPPPEGKALNDTPEWYQAKFSSYQERQAEREQSHEFLLRTKAVRQCELHDIRDQSNSGLPITHHIYHKSWRLAMWNAKVDSVLPSHERKQIIAAIPTKWLPRWIPAETSSTKPAKRPAEWVPPDFTFSTKRAKRPAEWMSPDFTSSAKRAKNAEKLADLGNRH